METTLRCSTGDACMLVPGALQRHASWHTGWSHAATLSHAGAAESLQACVLLHPMRGQLQKLVTCANVTRHDDLTHAVKPDAANADVNSCRRRPS
mmetsp:Transcript_25492/g.58030  ORF Transcript_25492/g.58030 Transcript_25492/m.58030 type:complete len:95 (+) Transcript_25492:308-592(+)